MRRPDAGSLESRLQLRVEYHRQNHYTYYTLQMTAHAINTKRPEPISGFPRVAAKIASDPDKTTVLFRRFDRLSARNILYLEAEIAELEAQQNTFDHQDLVAADQPTLESHTNWSKFERHAKETNADGTPKQPGQAAKMELVLKIREKLKEYRMCVKSMRLMRTHSEFIYR